jgi:hypothetical protein
MVEILELMTFLKRNKINMKHILSILLILVTVITSCDGRKTKHQALTDSIEAFKADVTIQIDVYEPETYTEREVDTLLSNGYNVKIKAYTDMDNSVLFTKIKDTINYQTYYRNYKFEVLIEKEGKTIYQDSFDKSRMNNELENALNINSSALLDNFNTQAVLKSIQLDAELSSNDVIYIDIAYAIPNSNIIDWHTLMVTKNGEANFGSKKIN